MGAIRSEVRDQHLQYHPAEELFLTAFLPGFFITWGRRRVAFNTGLSVYFLNPEQHISDTYGIDLEMLLTYSPYENMEPRAVQSVEAFFAEPPARGRVEKLIYFFVSEDPNVHEWFQQYAAENQEARLAIAIYAGDLRTHSGDAWFVRNMMNKTIYGRDLFDLRLPLEHDVSFFGRKDLSIDLLNAVKRGENRGIFGLRKTGKTSLLFKLERLLTSDGAAKVLYYDCKLPSIRKATWNELLGQICLDIARLFSLKIDPNTNPLTVDRTFIDVVQRSLSRVLLVFDEIEYISPVAIDDPHWHKDFVNFWQAFWSVQSKSRKISTLIAGVNPSVVEMDAIGGIQNPLFGIVSHQYLRGLSLEDTRTMLRTLGRRMGLRFEEEAIRHIHEHYGGHPLLVRIACSILNSQFRDKGIARPIQVTARVLAGDEKERDEELAFYCRHVVSELRQFYLSEYEMLELLACNQVVDFIDLDTQLGTTSHLVSYGLIEKASGKLPAVAIPVIGRYVAMEQARRSGRRTLTYITASGERTSWLARRKQAILHDLRLLEKTIGSRSGVPIFGPGGIPEADHFMAIEVVTDANSFERFINVCNRCIVESIENFGSFIGKNRYFWNEIKNAYPEFWTACLRIKLYRHERFHIQLTEMASTELLGFLKLDLDGNSVNAALDGYFTLQQCVLDSLLTAIQVETSART